MVDGNTPGEQQKNSFRFIDKRRSMQEKVDLKQPPQQPENQSNSSTPNQLKEENGKTKSQPAGKRAQSQPMTFDLFIQSLGQQAMMAMGLLSWPDGLIKKDPQRARELIDLIALLQEKTKGNLVDDEEKLFNILLYQLRIAFVKMMQNDHKSPPSTSSGKTG